MKKLFIVLALLCLTTNVFSQEENETTQFPNENVRLLSFNLLTPFAFDTPRYRLGYTHGLSGHLRVGLEVGYGSENTTLSIFQNDFNERDNYSLFEVLPQVTYIFNPTRTINHYIALQGFYLNQNERFFNDGFYETDLRVGISYDQADYNRIKIGANLLYGVYIPFGDSPFGIDISGGFGIRSRKNTYSNLINPRVNDFFDEQEFLSFGDDFRQNSGTTVGLNFSLNIKLTYNLMSLLNVK